MDGSLKTIVADNEERASELRWRVIHHRHTIDQLLAALAELEAVAREQLARARQARLKAAARAGGRRGRSPA